MFSLHPTNHKVKEYKLLSAGQALAAGRGESRGITSYGLDYSPVDGKIWYSKLNGNRIGRIDPNEPDGSIKEDFKLSDLRGKHVILFFWPLDFTFVCPTEIIAMDHRSSSFNDAGVEIVGISIDSQYTHHAWRNTPIDQGGIGPVKRVLRSLDIASFGPAFADLLHQRDPALRNGVLELARIQGIVLNDV